MVTKTSIAEHLRDETMPTKEELKTTVSLLPLFLSNTTFKILSLAISLAFLRQWAFLVSFIFPLAVTECFGCRRYWNHLVPGNFNHLTKLLTVEFPGKIDTVKQKIEKCVFNNILWISVHTLVLTGLVFFANCYPETYIYNWGDLFLPKEENSDSTNNRTASPLNATTLAPPNATTLDPINTTTANAVSNSESLLDNIYSTLCLMDIS